MSKAGKIILCLAIALTGCSTAPRKATKVRPPDWEGEDIVKPEPVVPHAPLPDPALPQTNPLVEPAGAETWLSLERWSRMQGLGAPRKLASESAPAYVLSASNGLFALKVGSRLASWNGVGMHLGFAPQLIDGQPFIHAFDARKNFFPLLSEFASLPTTNRVIVIDPGHGGVDAGAKSVFTGRHEKELTLDWARRVAALLATNGWTIFLTRTNDVEVSLTQRVAFAEARQADLFVSLHFNSATRQDQAGVETYCLTPTGMPSNLTRGFDDDVSRRFPNNAFDTQNLQHAVRLHRALLQLEGLNDRGVRRARFLTVLRGQNRPAVLIEGGYLSNPEEARRIADPEYRQKLAEAVGTGLE